MLVNCPKCGFSQPKDHYCAKCGVDMDAFTPAGPSLVSKVFGHPALHIGLVFVLVFLAVLFIKGREKKTFLEQVDQIPRGMVTLDKKAESPPPPVAEASAFAQTPEPDLQPTPESASTSAATTPTATPTATGTPETSASHKVHLKVLYAEVDLITLQKWVPEMQSAGQYSDLDFKMGILPNLQKKIDADRSIVIMDTVNRTWPNLPGQQDWLISLPRTNAGLRTRVQLSEMDAGLVKGEIRMVRNIEPEDPKSFDADFEVQARAGWVFWNLISPKTKNGLEQVQNPLSFFQIYKSARFKSLRTDFTIFFLFDTPSNP